MSEYLKTEKKNNIFYITIDRQKQLNAINRDIMDELTDIVGSVRTSDVRAVILTGAGEKAFVAGGDISEMKDKNAVEAKEFAENSHKLIQTFRECPVPVIAAVNGYALGGGFEIALACDFIYASKNAMFGFPEVKLGIIPGFGGTQLLSRVAGPNVAKELIFSGRFIKAEEAAALRIVNKVTEPENLIAETEKYIKEVAARGPLAVSLAKQTIDKGFNLSLDEALTIEATSFSILFSTKDQKEGMKAFFDKKDPEFRGE
jgi:enoyl-CoA hydratase